MTYLYAISYSKNSSLIKVGMAASWEKRLEQLKVPKVMKIEFVVKTFSDTYKSEKIIHSQLEKFRLPQSEYFYFTTLNQISTLKKMFSKHGEFVDTSVSTRIEKARVRQAWVPRQGPLETLYISRAKA